VAVTHAEAIREHYTSALDGLWSSLAGTVTVLEQLAADPEELDDETTLVLLPGLQYSLHRAGELVHGIAPPPGTREAHRELEAALEDARDVTGDVAALLEADDSETAAQLVLEWRGALFRVRLARRRLVRGLGAFLAGAVLVTWPLWAAGLALVAGALLAYRPS
jgi:hypothetical protein